METGSIAKPVPVPAPQAPQRVEALAQAGAVKSELPPESSVQQTEAPEAVRFESSVETDRRAALDTVLRQVIKRNIAIDPKSREVVTQSIDERTGEVVRQTPDAALIKLRAYAREMRQADSSGVSQNPWREKIA